MPVTEKMLNAACAEMKNQDVAQMHTGDFYDAANNPACMWIEGYFDLKKIIEAALAAQ